ncbi:MAG TPA: metallophosphoesterase, partial [Tepidisphaeraceae bacterium]|nr:metallophosphoesterase [Tepidisphaeraceae bacterium]
MQVETEILERGAWLQLGLPTRFDIKRFRFPSRAGNLRIVHLSDTHLRPGWPSGLDRLIRIIRDAQPNLICFTGDWIDDKLDPRPASAASRRLAESLCAIAPTITCLGNHDGDFLAPLLIDAGVITLL